MGHQAPRSAASAVELLGGPAVKTQTVPVCTVIRRLGLDKRFSHPAEVHIRLVCTSGIWMNKQKE